LEKVRREQASLSVPNEGESQAAAPPHGGLVEAAARQRAGLPARQHAPTPTADQNELADLRAEVAALRREVEELASAFRRHGEEFERLRVSLGG
ncbi:MAG: hypothetical protein ACREHD_26340, partial [Pirellulales bacterium]